MSIPRNRAKDLQEMVKNLWEKKKKGTAAFLWDSTYRNVKISAKAAATDTELKSIMDSIDSNPSLGNIAKGTKIRLRGYSLIDGLANLGESIVYGSVNSWKYGRLSIRWRRGYLEKMLPWLKKLKVS